MTRFLPLFSIRRVTIFVGLVLFLVVVSSCVHASNPTHHVNDTGSATCDLSETISNVALSKESMGLLFLFALLALSFSLQAHTSYPGRDIYRNLSVLYEVPIHTDSFFEVFDPFLIALRKGIIHPKLYSTHLS